MWVDAPPPPRPNFPFLAKGRVGSDRFQPACLSPSQFSWAFKGCLIIDGGGCLPGRWGPRELRFLQFEGRWQCPGGSLGSSLPASQPVTLGGSRLDPGLGRCIHETVCCQGLGRWSPDPLSHHPGLSYHLMGQKLLRYHLESPLGIAMVTPAAPVFSQQGFRPWLPVPRRLCQACPGPSSLPACAPLWVCWVLLPCLSVAGHVPLERRPQLLSQWCPLP